MGGCYLAPVLHIHYSYVLPYFVPQMSPIGVIKKLIIDQGVFAPSFMLTFYPMLNFVDGNGWQQGIQDIKDKYVQTIYANWKVWIPAGIINFQLVPIQYQVLFANFVSLFFNAYLSYMHNSYKKVPEASKPEDVKVEI
eukprot:403359893